MGLERWLSTEEHVLFLWRTRVQFPAPIQAHNQPVPGTLMPSSSLYGQYMRMVNAGKMFIHRKEKSFLKCKSIEISTKKVC